MFATLEFPEVFKFYEYLIDALIFDHLNGAI